MFMISKSNKDMRALLLKVHSMVMKMGGYAEEAEDIAQEVMIKLLTSKATPSLINHGWLFRVVHNCVIDFRRRSARRNRLIDRKFFVDLNGAVCDSADETIMFMTAQRETAPQWEPEVLDKVALATQSLRTPVRKALMMHANGYTYEEIASATNANIGTVRSRIHYGRKRAREIVGEIA